MNVLPKINVSPTMNIAIVASAFHPSVGGVEELVRQLAPSSAGEAGARSS